MSPGPSRKMARHWQIAGMLWVCVTGCGGAARSPSPPGPVAVAAPRVAPPSAAPEPTLPRAFEGMWLPEQIPAQADTLRRLGLVIAPQELSDPTSNVLASVVSLGGCSASFVSAEGLIATNHHCAVRALQYNSMPTEDLLERGFLAATRPAERWAGPTGRVLITLSIRDVTERVAPALAAESDPVARELAYESQQKQQVKECEQGRPNVRCQLVTFYAGQKFSLIERLELRDVRLVYAPPDGVGNFGGEVDNWRWPRHAGDVAFFRAYVAPDGNAADHQANNVPYRPKHWLALAKQPLASGDLVLVAGYPGKTSRLALRRELQDTVLWAYPRRLALFEAYTGALTAVGQRDPDAKLRAVSWIRGFDNYRTKHQGELAGIERSHLLDRKLEQEQRLQRFIESDATRAAQYSDLNRRLEAAFDEFARTREADAALESEVSMPRLMSAASRIVRMAEERARPDAERDPEYQERNVHNLRDELKGLDRLYARKLDEAVLELALSRLLATPPAQRSGALELLVGKQPTRPAIQQTVQRLYAGTRLADATIRLSLFERATSAELAHHPDALIRAAVALRPLLRDAELHQKRLAGQLLQLKPLYLAAQAALEPRQVPPDANGTLRVAFGNVKPDESHPGSRPFTTLSELVAKHTGQAPFNAPERLLVAAREASQSRFFEASLADVPVDFLSNVMITNGNSGSATLNARGELVGLAFDGTFESVASDWTPLDNTRSIHVDLRYVLWLLAEVEHASALLTELGLALR